LAAILIIVLLTAFAIAAMVTALVFWRSRRNRLGMG
jgi:hypothetical protein